LINPLNKQKILKLAIDIITDETRENEKLINSWVSAFSTVVGRTDILYVQQVAVKPIADMMGSKNPLPRRKLGNRLVVEMAKAIGEEGMDEEPRVMQLIQSMCYDTNYKIRLDGAEFFKDYITANFAKLMECDQWEDVYLAELFELLGDEESYVRMDAIEGCTAILDKID
jgi:hypothetical protein